MPKTLCVLYLELWHSWNNVNLKTKLQRIFLKLENLVLWHENSCLLLWDALNINNFYFILFYFSILLYFFFFLKSDEEAHDNEVTWQVTWCDVTSLEHDRRVWKMMSGHMEYIWWPWIGHEAGMRMKHGHKSRVNYW